MEHFFYFLGSIFVLWEMVSLSQLTKVHGFVMEFESMSGTPLENRPPTHTVYSFFMLFYFVWAVLGLFTFQWPLFLILLFLSFIKKNKMLFRAVNAFLSLSILLFILINAFNFKIDVWKWIVGLF